MTGWSCTCPVEDTDTLADTATEAPPVNKNPNKVNHGDRLAAAQQPLAGWQPTVKAAQNPCRQAACSHFASMQMHCSYMKDTPTPERHTEFGLVSSHAWAVAVEAEADARAVVAAV